LLTWPVSLPPTAGPRPSSEWSFLSPSSYFLFLTSCFASPPPVAKPQPETLAARRPFGAGRERGGKRDGPPRSGGGAAAAPRLAPGCLLPPLQGERAATPRRAANRAGPAPRRGLGGEEGEGARPRSGAGGAAAPRLAPGYLRAPLQGGQTGPRRVLDRANPQSAIRNPQPIPQSSAANLRCAAPPLGVPGRRRVYSEVRVFWGRWALRSEFVHGR
jgi:hypothetical protein